MYSLEAVGDFTEEIYYKMQTVEPDKLVDYCNSINESATESAKNVTNGVKTLFAKIMANVYEEEVVGMEGDNPLLIDLVVRKVFKYLSLTQLGSCRHVCKLWNEEASAIFRQKQSIIFYPESVCKMSTFTRFVALSKKFYSGESTKDSSKYPGPPFSTYCFTAQYKSTQFPPEIMQNFVATCGEYVRKLEIFYPDEAYLSPSDFTRFYLFGMPNLESLHIVNLPRNLTQSSLNLNDDLGQGQPHQQSAITHLRIDRTWQMETVWGANFLRDLLHLMPSLIDYELWTWNSTTEDAHSAPYLSSLSPKNVQNLRTLRPGSIGDSLALQVSSMGLHLTKLYLPVLNQAVCAESIELLLTSQHGTLEEFQLNCSTMQDSRLLTFTRMEKLKSLEIMITYPWNNDYTTFTPSIDYHAHFPRIKVLRVELAIYNDANFMNYFFPGNAHSCHTLEELDISFSGFRDDKFIRGVAGIFPNLKVLRLDGYGSRIFSSIFTYMTNLESLKLYLIYGFNVDDQMTGLSKDVCGRIRKKKEKVGREEWVKKVEVDEMEMNPSLRSLKRLRSLSIKQKDYQAKFWPDAQCITNITGYLALAQMKQLTRLHIERVQFTEECKQYLATALENCWLDFV